jgi:uncharacterized protein (UPF0548 family)
VADQKDSAARQTGRGSLDAGRIERFAFAHGCLRGHLLAGEERFSVEWDHSDDSVWWAAARAMALPPGCRAAYMARPAPAQLLPGAARRHAAPPARHQLTSLPSPLSSLPPSLHLKHRYEIHTFSRPGHFLALLSYPLVRLMQMRFAHDSTRLVQRKLKPLPFLPGSSR